MAFLEASDTIQLFPHKNPYKSFPSETKTGETRPKIGSDAVKNRYLPRGVLFYRRTFVIIRTVHESITPPSFVLITFNSTVKI